MLLKTLRDGLLDLVLSDACPGCAGPPGRPTCPSCAASLARGPAPAMPDPAPPGLPEPWAAAAYAGPPRALVIAHKENGRLALAAPLGAALAGAVIAAAPARGDLILVPVPSARASRRARGHDPTWRLACAAARVLYRQGRVARPVRALRHARPVRDQAGLGHGARFANLSGALELSAPGARRLGRSSGVVVVVDDIVTSGATLAESVRALRTGRVTVAGVAVVAATRRAGPAGRAAG